MDLKEYRSKKTKLQHDITKQVYILVEEFKKETGMSPDNICINMLSTARFGDVNPGYVVDNCMVNIEI